MRHAIPLLAMIAVFSSGLVLLPASGTVPEIPQPLDPPSQQLAKGVFPLAVQCNGWRQLYVMDTLDPLCLYESTYKALLQRGADLTVAADSDMPHNVTIGMLAPLTGGAAQYGRDINTAFMLALDDFNAILAEKGHSWRLESSTHDTQTSREVTAKKIRELNNAGIKIVAGPSIDIFGTDVTEYADANGMLLFSCCSEISSLSIEGDSLMRMIQSQYIRSLMFSSYMEGEVGIRTVVPISRDTEWASGTVSLAIEDFTDAGGSATDHIKYGKDGAFSDSHIQALADTVHDLLQSGNASEVAVLYVGLEETYDFMEAASAHDVLGQVRWFGTNASKIQHNNTAGLAFAEQVKFTVIEPAFYDSNAADRVTEYILEVNGRQPSIHAMLAYDVVHLIGRAMQDAQTSNPADVAGAIKRVAWNYEGATGEHIMFDPAGDRCHMHYAFLKLEGGEWIEISRVDDC